MYLSFVVDNYILVSEIINLFSKTIESYSIEKINEIPKLLILKIKNNEEDTALKLLNTLQLLAENILSSQTKTPNSNNNTYH